MRLVNWYHVPVQKVFKHLRHLSSGYHFVVREWLHVLGAAELIIDNNFDIRAVSQHILFSDVDRLSAARLQNHDSAVVLSNTKVTNCVLVLNNAVQPSLPGKELFKPFTDRVLVA